MPRGDSTYIDAEILLINFPGNQTKLDQFILDKRLESPNPSDGMPRGTTTSNPTESKALAILESRQREELTMLLLPVETTLEYIEKNDPRAEQTKAIIRLYCWEGRTQEVTAGLTLCRQPYVCEKVEEVICMVEAMNEAIKAAARQFDQSQAN